MSHDPSQLWSEILSRDDRRIKIAYLSLLPEEQASVLQHLNKMTKETGWLQSQQESAQDALDAINSLFG